MDSMRQLENQPTWRKETQKVRPESATEDETTANKSGEGPKENTHSHTTPSKPTPISWASIVRSDPGKASQVPQYMKERIDMSKQILDKANIRAVRKPKPVPAYF